MHFSNTLQKLLNLRKNPKKHLTRNPSDKNSKNSKDNLSGLLETSQAKEK